MRALLIANPLPARRFFSYMFEPIANSPMYRIALSAILLCLTASASADEPSLPTELTAAQIVARNVSARGGLDAWRKIESVIWVGHVERSDSPMPSTPFLLEQKRPNKSRFELKSMKQNTVRVFDGVRGWKLRPTKGNATAEGPEVQPFTADELRFARETSDIESPLMDYEAKGVAIALDGLDEVDGRKTYRLNVRLPSGLVHHFWIDAETFLDVKCDRVSRNAAGLTAQVSVYYRDFKTVEAVQIPTLIETGIGAAKPTDRMVIEKISFNTPLDDRTFTKPSTARDKRNPLSMRSGTPQSVQEAPRPTN